MAAPIIVNPEIMHGTPCFAGTRVPAQILFDYLEGGDTIDEFLEQYPTVRREQVLAVLQESKQRVEQAAAAVGV